MHDDPAPVGHRTVTADAVATFGGITGDYSRIHFDHELGKTTPHGRGFAHGLLGASWALGALTLHAPERVGAGEPGAHVSGFEVRFHDVIRFGDTLALCCDDARSEGSHAGCERGRTDFSLVDQDGRRTTSGVVEVEARDPEHSEAHGKGGESAHPIWTGGAYHPPPGPEIWSAEDVREHGPRGASRVRTLSEADVMSYVHFSGELNPLYIDAPFAEQTRFGRRIAPPMLCFCLGFSVWLRELLRLPLGGDPRSAGHLGDRWRFVAPVHVGDTLEVRYRPLALRPTRSDPARGIATFGLQLVNQHEQVVQQGEVDMMLAMRRSSPLAFGAAERGGKPGGGR